MKAKITSLMLMVGVLVPGLAVPGTARADHDITLLAGGGYGGTGPFELCIFSPCTRTSAEGGILNLSGGYLYTNGLLRAGARLEGGLVIGEQHRFGGFAWTLGHVGLNTRYIFAEVGGGIGLSALKDSAAIVFPAQLRLGVRIVKNLAIVGHFTFAYGPDHMTGFVGGGLEWTL